MAQRYRPEALGKLMAYILGYRPDEYGLLPDQEGFVSLKELRQAIGEEEGWGFVRESHLQEVVLTDPEGRFEIREGKIRATFRKIPPIPGERVVPPKVLYHSCRKRAYPVILKRGLQAGNPPYVLLTESRELAQRIGRRRDPKPVILEVQAKRAWEEAGVPFYRPLPLLYLAGPIPPSFLWGPPVDKVLEEIPSKGEEERAALSGIEVSKGKDWKRQARKFRRTYKGF